MKRFLIGSLVVVAALAVVAYAFRGPLTMRVMEKVVAQRMSANLLEQLPDGLHVGLCGAGSPLPDPLRSGPCTAIIAGDRVFLVDAGTGSSRVLGQMQIPHANVEAILLTHFHSDHIDGLGEMLLQIWVNGGRTEPTPLIGPTGVEEIAAGVNAAYAQDHRYRVAHHGEDVVPDSGGGATAIPFPQPAVGEGAVLLDDGGLRITAFRVDHEPVDPAVGYRFDYRGRSVVVSGDTKQSANLEHFAAGSDLLVHEALAPQLVAVMTTSAEAAKRPRIAKITRDIVGYHTSPVEAAESAQAAGVGHLLFSHIVPPLPLASMDAIFLDGVSEAYAGPVTLGRDGTFVSMPSGSDEIVVEDRL